MAAKKPDWAAIQADYIAGIKPKELSQKYGIAPKTISNRASADGWGEAREELREELGNILPKTDKLSALVDQAAEIFARQLRDLEELWTGIMDEARAVKAATYREVGTPAGPTSVAVSPMDRLNGLKQAATSLKETQVAMRRALGLEDKEKPAGAGAGGDETEETGVIVMPPLDPLPDEKDKPHEPHT